MGPASKRTSGRRFGWLWLAGAALLAAPGAGQNSQAPKSLLPPGFDAPPAPNVATPALLPTDPAPAATDAPQDALLPTTQPPPPATDSVASRNPGNPVGLVAPAPGNPEAAAFTGSNGRFAVALAARITAPIASRWAMITLRRALLLAVPGPAGIGDGDWVAARAGLLLRLGEMDGARRLVDALPIDQFTPNLYGVAAQVSLAAGDIAGLCPIAATGRALLGTPLWDLAWAMCAAMDGDDVTAANIIDGLRRQRRRVAAFDVRLAQRVVVLAGGAGRAEGINWAEVPGITLYRYGVASASGVPVPADRLALLGPAVAGWAVRNPGLGSDARLAMSRRAAVLGAISGRDLASAISGLSPSDANGGFPSGSRAAHLRDAFTAGSARDKAAAIAAIRAEVAAGEDPYGALIETATAAAALPPATALAGQADQIIAALLSVGDTIRARAWWPVAAKADAVVKARSWALLATGSSGIPLAPTDFRDWRNQTHASPRGAAILAAALSGLGLTQGSDWADLLKNSDTSLDNHWTKAIAAAARRRATGEVALLAATGLQGRWNDVPPAHVQAIVAAYMASGQTQQARQFAAEAVTRAAGGLPGGG